MGDKGRNYSEMTLKRLFALSGNKCAFPNCTAEIVNEKTAINSNICHIEAANKDGERYNENMTDKQRADYENLILLCLNHHKETDDVNKYTVDVLKKMKKDHESKFLNQQMNKPSMLKNVINAIASISFDSSDSLENLTVFNPKDKLIYNSVKINYSLIQEYKTSQGKLNELYDELELQGSIKKEKLLQNINHIYISVKGKYILDSDNYIEIIKQNSDNIISDVFSELHKKVENTELSEEDIIIGITIIMVDAFIRCKILEEPK